MAICWEARKSDQQGRFVNFNEEVEKETSMGPRMATALFVAGQNPSPWAQGGLILFDAVMVVVAGVCIWHIYVLPYLQCHQYIRCK
jgi:hypothetical protein